VLGYYSFKVVRDSKLIPEGKEATTLFGDELISILPELKGPHLLNVVIHELMHVAWLLADVSAGSQEEEYVVTVLSNKETELWMRNPELVKWKSEIVGV
jgi:hypothetical protein